MGWDVRFLPERLEACDKTQRNSSAQDACCATYHALQEWVTQTEDCMGRDLPAATAAHDQEKSPAALRYMKYKEAREGHRERGGRGARKGGRGSGRGSTKGRGHGKGDGKGYR